jgi:hypothetical protein
MTTYISLKRLDLAVKIQGNAYFKGAFIEGDPGRNIQPIALIAKALDSFEK